MRNESNQLPDSSDETRQLVARFKEMEENRKSVYFDSEELISIAEFYAYNNQPEESSKVLEYALKIHPENLDIQLYRCRALMAEGKTEDAERFLDLITDQNDREVIFLRAEILLEQFRSHPCVRRDEELLAYYKEQGYDVEEIEKEDGGEA